MNIEEIKIQLKNLDIKIDKISNNEILIDEFSTAEDVKRLKNFLIENNLTFEIKKIFNITKKDVNDIEKTQKTLKFCGELIEQIVAIGLPMEDNQKLIEMLRKYMEEMNQE